MNMTSVKGKRVTLMGLGRFGGGSGAARWLASQGAQVLVTDMQSAEKLAEPVAEVQDLIDTGSVTLRLGEHREEDFARAELVIANPAVPKPWENLYLRAAERAGVPIATEITLLIERLPNRERTIGITGSVGKSTTTAMIADAMQATGSRVVMGGNIGGSLLAEVSTIGPKDWLVLELSSAMLYWIGRLIKWSPAIGVCTNIAPNHMDWHGSAEHYSESKQEMLRYQRPGDAAILGPSVREWAAVTPAKAIAAGDEPFGGEMLIPGRHNRVNAAVALAACDAAVARVGERVVPGAFAARLSAFGGLPHRLQLVTKRDGIAYYNDSKCTTPEALMQAIGALTEATNGRAEHLHVLVGGYDKKISLTEVAALAARVGGLWCIGATGPKIAAEARAFAPAQAGRVHVHATLADAVRAARLVLKAGGALVLSPASASWDQYPNYEHRGEEFIRLVHQ